MMNLKLSRGLLFMVGLANPVMGQTEQSGTTSHSAADPSKPGNPTKAGKKKAAKHCKDGMKGKGHEHCETKTPEPGMTEPGMNEKVPEGSSTQP